MHRAKPSSKVRIWAGTSQKQTYVPLQEISANLLRNSSIALLPFHAITSCDSNLFICGNIKKTAWLVTKHSVMLAWHAETITSAEEFVSRMYKTSKDSLDLDRVVLLGKFSSQEKLSPTSNAFKQHLKRCHYQTAVWCQAHIQKPVFPYPEETSWTLAEDLLVSVFDTRSNPEGYSEDDFMRSDK